MFTGLVEETGTVIALERGHEGARIGIAANLAADLRPGDSVSVSGACLTAIDPTGENFHADVMNQTLELTTLGELEVGSTVNLETALKAGQPMGGHVVQGHVDGVGTITDVTPDGVARWLTVDVPQELRHLVVEHGSIAINGVSLTVARLTDTGFAVSLIPETVQRTNLGQLDRHDRVNLEVDVLARYVERIMAKTAGRDNGS